MKKLHPGASHNGNVAGPSWFGNLHGALQQVALAETNKEKAEALSRATEELYRSLGVLLVTRYIGRLGEQDKPMDEDVRVLIRDYFEQPTFDSWMRLCNQCVERLRSMGDRFATDLDVNAAEDLQEEDITKAKEILKEIHKLRSGSIYPPRKMSVGYVLQQIRLLRNFRGHEWDSNTVLQPLIALGTVDFTSRLIASVFAGLYVETIYVKAIHEDAVDCVTIRGHEKRLGRKPRSEQVPSEPGGMYLRFYEDEGPFSYRTNLVRYSPSDQNVYVFVRRSGDRKFLYESVSTSGQIPKLVLEFLSLEDVFGLAEGELSRATTLETAQQRFGKLFIENDIVHNLPDVVEDYVPRPKPEEQLLEKLRHRRLYITTLDGGGGFGKTELAKQVVWSIMRTADKNQLPENLRFKYFVWVTGKTEFFERGAIERRPQTFKTLEDLTDSILYVTGNHQLIAKTLDEKRTLIPKILDREGPTLLVLDNLETVEEKEQVQQFLVHLGDQVSAEIKAVLTSRTRVGEVEQRLNLRSMEPEEAKALALLEMRRHDVSEKYHDDALLDKFVKSTGSIPLLIKHGVRLLSKGYTPDELLKNLPKDSDQALNFMCDCQWRGLNDSAKKLLLGIGFNGGKLNFAQAKLLCSLSDHAFQAAREELQDSSFLVDQELINSLLVILPPIAKFVRMKLDEVPSLEEELIEANALLAPIPSQVGKATVAGEFTDEIALNQLFHRADLLIRRGAILEAYDWYKQATDRFPENSVAWRAKGDFEFRHLEDDVAARESFDRALSLNNRDPTTYALLGYWESEWGGRISRKVYIKRGVECYQKAIGLSTRNEDKRPHRLGIGQAYMKLGFIARDESYRTSQWEKKGELIEEKNEYFTKAIESFRSVLIPDPKGFEEIRNNTNVHNQLATALLMLGTTRHPERTKFDLSALLHLIEGLTLNPRDNRLRYTLNHPGLRTVLSGYGINSSNLNSCDLPQILALSDRVRTTLGVDAI